MNQPRLIVLCPDEPSPRREGPYKPRLSAEQCGDLRTLHRDGWTYVQLAKRFAISYWTARNIASGQTRLP